MRRYAAVDVDMGKQNGMWREQEGVCAVTGLQMLPIGHKRHPLAATVTWLPDYRARINEAKPVLCAYFINVLLRSFSLAEVLDVVRQASAHARILLTTPPQAISIANREIPQDIMRQLARALNNSLRRAVSRKKLQKVAERHTLTLQAVKDMWLQQAGRCAISGVTMTARRAGGVGADMLTLDRIDSSLGYTKKNTQLCTFACNLCKSDSLQEDFLQMLASIHL